MIELWHSTLEFELRRLEHFATKAAARARVAEGFAATGVVQEILNWPGVSP